MLGRQGKSEVPSKPHIEQLTFIVGPWPDNPLRFRMEIEAILSNLFAINAVLIKHCAVLGVVAIVNVRVSVVAIFFDAQITLVDLVEFIIKTFRAAPFTRSGIVN
jgi:hypothetical protein